MRKSSRRIHLKFMSRRLNLNMTRIAAIALAVSMVCACNDQWKKVWDDVLNTVTVIEKNKDWVETFVSDLKRTVDLKDPRYQQAKRDFSQARSLNESFLNAVKAAIETNEPASDLTEIASQASAASADFL